MFKMPVGSDRFAYAVMLSESPHVAFYAEDTTFDDEGSPNSDPLLIVPVERSAYARGQWGKPIHLVPEEDRASIPKFFWQNATNKWDCRIVDPISRRKIVARPEDCTELEREAAWAQVHIDSRIIDTLTGRPNGFAESLRVKL